MIPSETTLAVVGAGVMGRGIIQWAAQLGLDVLVFDSQPQGAATAITFVSNRFSYAVDKGRMTPSARQDALSRIRRVENLEDLFRSDIIVEAIAENLAAKQELFGRLEAIVPPGTILCTNTSSLSVTACATKCRHPERVAGLHFFNPAPVMKVVEIVRGERTAPSVIDRLSTLVAQSGHRAIRCGDSPGFVINHAGRALITEGLRIIQEGVASPVDVDRVVREAMGFPMGPFELFDLTGLDVSGPVLRQIYEGNLHEARLRPTPLIFARQTAGLLGRKVGSGFYQYADGRKVEPAEDPVRQGPCSTFSLDIENVAISTRVHSILSESGLAESSPQASDVVVVAPLGDDATSTAVKAGYDARKVVAIDALLPSVFESGRVTLMTTPVTSEDAVRTVMAALQSAGLRVTRIADSPGLISQRITAHIVNVACEIAQQNIGSPRDVDDGMVAGLGYPRGGLTMGDVLGPSTILRILERLLQQTGDPRYRASMWLRRRASLGVSLLTG